MEDKFPFIQLTPLFDVVFLYELNLLESNTNLSIYINLMCSISGTCEIDGKTLRLHCRRDTISFIIFCISIISLVELFKQ